MSYLSQMVALAIHNFVSAADGHRHRRGPGARHRPALGQDPGQFLGGSGPDDLYLLLPICLVFAVFLVSQGMIQNFKPYTKAKLLEPMKISVEKKNDKGETIKGPDGNPVMEEQTVTEQTIVAGADGLAGRHQDARHQRRRLLQRQRRASLRESDAAVELPPDALHLLHRQRADLLPRPDGQEPGTRLVGLGGDDGLVPGRGAALLAVGGRRAIRFISSLASPRRPATWKARKSASASSIPRCLPR